MMWALSRLLFLSISVSYILVKNEICVACFFTFFFLHVDEAVRFLIDRNDAGALEIIRGPDIADKELVQTIVAEAKTLQSQ